MKDCVFCKIVKGEIDSAKIREDKDFIAILDINPNTKGMVLVLSKNHHDSYVFDDTDDFYASFMMAAKKVARMIEKGLGVKRVALVMEGMGVNHAHLKLYPLHKVMEKFQETWAKEKIFFEKYEGFISTQLGPQIDIKDLKKLAEEIKSKNS